MEALNVLHKKFDICIVTSRHLVTNLLFIESKRQFIEEITRKWINEHFPGLIKEIYIGNLWNSEGRKM